MPRPMGLLNLIVSPSLKCDDFLGGIERDVANGDRLGGEFRSHERRVWLLVPRLCLGTHFPEALL
jgi:hypothetical protein